MDRMASSRPRNRADHTCWPWKGRRTRRPRPFSRAAAATPEGKLKSVARRPPDSTSGFSAPPQNDSSSRILVTVPMGRPRGSASDPARLRLAVVEPEVVPFVAVLLEPPARLLGVGVPGVRQTEDLVVVHPLLLDGLPLEEEAPVLRAPVEDEEVVAGQGHQDRRRGERREDPSPHHGEILTPG